MYKQFKGLNQEFAPNENYGVVFRISFITVIGLKTPNFTKKRRG
jgi:hypothetical protein